jgi:hypothetical protein
MHTFNNDTERLEYIRESAERHGIYIPEFDAELWEPVHEGETMEEAAEHYTRAVAEALTDLNPYALTMAQGEALDID